jgi:hypothetical protein
MKLQLDTTNKTILIDQEVTFGDLLDTLEEILPNGRWAEYKLIPNQTLHWTTYQMYTPNIQPLTNPVPDYPWIVTANAQDNSYDVKPGIFNISTGE